MADRVNVEPIDALDGGSLVNDTVWSALTPVNWRDTEVGLKAAFPAWEPVIVQVPSPVTLIWVPFPVSWQAPAPESETFSPDVDTAATVATDANGTDPDGTVTNVTV